MKELLEGLPTIKKEDAKHYTLLDTCYLVHIMKFHDKIKHLEKTLANGDFAITSFNAEELMYIEQRLEADVKTNLRHFLKKKPNLHLLKIPVHPGILESEHEYVNEVDVTIKKVVEDPSDAVLFATAVVLESDIITRDKHHIFTQLAEELASRYRFTIKKKINEHV